MRPRKPRTPRSLRLPSRAIKNNCIIACRYRDVARPRSEVPAGPPGDEFRSVGGRTGLAWNFLYDTVVPIDGNARRFSACSWELRSRTADSYTPTFGIFYKFASRRTLWVINLLRTDGGIESRERVEFIRSLRFQLCSTNETLP